MSIIAPPIQTGAQTSIKAEAIDGGKAVAASIAQANQDADKAEKELAKGQTLYTKSGEPTFNCLTEKNKPICFAGGRFIVADDDLDAEAIKTALDYHVSRSVLTKREGRD